MKSSRQINAWPIAPGPRSAGGRQSWITKLTAPSSAAFSAHPSAFLVLIVLLALALRLLVWRWHAPYPLGGDEREYLDQALTLLRDRRYEELRLMRPPLYTGFLAAAIYLLDSLVQRLRLVQALISALTVLPVHALALRITGQRGAALAAALLTALSYTLAATATELLSETLFLFGLTVLLWLLLSAPDRQPGAPQRWRAAAAGLALGALVLLRSVALPLLPLGALWLLLSNPAPSTARRASRASAWFAALGSHEGRRGLAPALAFVLAAALVVAPWTLRNALAYGALIAVDTSGAENLWLDNDPAGREAVKAQLYALGGDLAARQQLASQRGAQAILADPGRFAAKAWGEAQAFFALQYFDDMRDRRAIWVPPAEVWLRLALGDGVWLLTLLAGALGLWFAPGRGSPAANHKAPGSRLQTYASADPRCLLAPWALYVLLTGLVFHVELRYRLPLYPALLPYAGWALARLRGWRAPLGRGQMARSVGAALTMLACVGLMLLHRPYLSESWMLARKHAALWQADRALASGAPEAAIDAAQRALAIDPQSALARVALAQADLQRGDPSAARAALDQALAAVPDQPRARMLRGAALLALGQSDAARRDLAYETATLEDAQGWAWDAFAPALPPPAALDVGGGLDLGAVRGFFPAEPGMFRWTGAASTARLAASGAGAIELRLNSGRPAGAPAPVVTVLANGREIGRATAEAGWRSYRFALPADLTGGDTLLVTLRSSTFRPRDLDRASPDDRELGVMVDEIRVVAP